MNTVDRRIVEMVFRNEQFERGIAESNSSLDRLRNSLDMPSATIFPGAIAGITNLISKFNVLDMVVFSVIQNMASRVLDFALSTAHDLMFGSMTKGFAGYEHIMDRTRVIYANAGAMFGRTMSEVSDATSILRDYAAVTVYTIEGLVDGLKTMSQARIDLEPATRAIMGLANAGAYVGASVEGINSALNIYSRFMGRGTQNLIEWDQFYRNMGGGVDLVNTIVEAAYAVGDLERSYVDAVRAGNIYFRDLINQNRSQGGYAQRLSAETFRYAAELFYANEHMSEAATRVQTLTRLWENMQTVVAKGWIETWQHIVGDVEESATWLTALSNWWTNDLIKPMSNARNEMLAFWSEFGGREDLFRGLINIGGALLGVIEPIADAFRDIFPPITGERLIAMTRSFREWTERLVVSEKTLNNLRRTMRGFFAIIDIGIQTLQFLGRVAQSVGLALWPIADGLLGVTANIGDIFTALSLSLRSGNFFDSLLDLVDQVIATIGIFIKEIWGVLFSFDFMPDSMLDGLMSLIDFIIGGVTLMLSSIENGFRSLGSLSMSGVNRFINRSEEAFSPFAFIGAVFTTVIDGILAAFRYLTSVLSTGIGFISDIFQSFGFEHFRDFLDFLLSAAFAYTLWNFSQAIRGFSDSFQELSTTITSVLGVTKAKVKTASILNLALAIGILAGALWVVSRIPTDDFQQAVIGLSLITAQMVLLSFTISRAALNAPQVKLVAASLVALAFGMVVIAGAARLLATADLSSMIAAMVGLTTMLIAMATILTLMHRLKSHNTEKSVMRTVTLLKGISSSMILMGLALIPMAASLRLIGGIEWPQILAAVAGITAVASVMVGLTALIYAMSNKDPVTIKKMALVAGVLAIASLALVAMAASLHILFPVMASLLEYEWYDLGKIASILSGVLAFITIIGLLSWGFAWISKTTFGIAPAVMAMIPVWIAAFAGSLAILGGGLLVFGNALRAFPLSAGELTGWTFGLLGIGLALGIVGALGVIGGLGLALWGSGLIVFSAGFTLFGRALYDFPMSTSQMTGWAFGLIGLALALALTGTLGAVAAMGLIPLAASLILFGISLSSFSIGIRAMEKVDSEAILTTIRDFLIFIGIFAASSIVLLPIIPLIVTFAGAISLLGLSLISLGAGLAVFALFGPLLRISLNTISDVIPLLIGILGTFLVTLVTSLGNTIESILIALANIIASLLNVIVTILFAAVAEAAIIGMAYFMQILADHQPYILDAGMRLVETFAKGIEENADRIVDSILGVTLSIFEALSDQLPAFYLAGLTLMVEFVLGIVENMDPATEIILESVETMVESITTSVVEYMPALSRSIINGLVSGLRDNSHLAESAIGGVATGMIRRFRDGWEIRNPSDVAIRDSWSIINSICDTIEEGTPIAARSMEGLAGAILEPFRRAGRGIVDSTRDWFGGFTGNIDLSLPDIFSSGERTSEYLGNGITSGMLDYVEPSLQRMYELTMRYGGEIPESLALRIAESAEANGYIVEEAARGIRARWLNTFDDLFDRDEEDRVRDLLPDFSEALRAPQRGGDRSGIGRASSAAAAAEREAQERERARLQASRELFDEESSRILHLRRINRINREEEIVEWSRIQRLFDRNSEQRVNAEISMFNAIVAHREDNIESMLEEYAVWSKLVDQFEKDSRQRRFIEIEMHDLRVDIANRNSDLLEREMDLRGQLADLDEDFEAQLESRANVIRRTFGLFDEVREREAVQMDELIGRQRDQRAETEAWFSAIRELQRRNVPPGMLEELVDKGIGALSYMESLAAASEGQLQYTINHHYAMARIAREQAELEAEWFGRTLEHMEARNEITNEIDELMEQVIGDVDFDDAIETLARRLEFSNVNPLANALRDAMVVVGEAGVEALTDDELASRYAAAGNQNGSNYAEGLSESNDSSRIAGNTIGMSAVYGASSPDIFDGMFSSGEYAGEGFVSGLLSMVDAAERAGHSIGRAGNIGINIGQDSRSMSRLNYRSGQYGGEGFLEGLLSMLDEVGAAGEKLGFKASDVILDAMRYACMMLENNKLDYQPVIRPLLDMEAAEAALANIFDNRQDLVVAEIASENTRVRRQRHETQRQREEGYKVHVDMGPFVINNELDIDRISNLLRSRIDGIGRARGV